jgi:2Fe-2S ferredoxin
MTKVTFISYTGITSVVDVEDGLTIMDGALMNGVPGIDGDCGGVCACATCKVLVDPAYADRVGTANEDEKEMLEFRSDVPFNARLCCQIVVTPDLDGITLHTPKSQDAAVFADA